MIKKILITIVLSTLVYILFYVYLSEYWSINLNINKKWICDGVPGINFSAAFFPNRGGASGPHNIDKILKACPEIKFDPGKETLFLSKINEINGMSYRPLLKWRLEKNYTYADIHWSETLTNGKLYVYVIPRNDIGYSK